MLCHWSCCNSDNSAFSLDVHASHNVLRGLGTSIRTAYSSCRRRGHLAESQDLADEAGYWFHDNHFLVPDHSCIRVMQPTVVTLEVTAPVKMYDNSFGGVIKQMTVHNMSNVLS